MQQFYFGWFVVGAAMLLFALITGSTFSAFGFYVLPVSNEFALSRADMNTGLIVLNLGNAVLAPFIGRLLDRLPARRIMAFCSILFGASLFALGLSKSLLLSASLLALPVAAGLLGAGTISITVLLARWFSVHRGRAMALSSIGMALGSIIVAPGISMVIEAEGWRTALVLCGGGVGVLLLILAVGLRERPGRNDIETRETPVAHRPESAADPAEATVTVTVPPPPLSILFMPLFMVFALGIALGTGVSQGLMVSLVPLAMESGLTTIESASLISAMGIAGIASMLLLAVVADRLDRTSLLALLIVGAALPSGLLLVADSFAVLLVAAVIIGFSQSATVPIYLALLADLFGLAAFGTVRGLIVPVMSVVSALVVRFIGEVYDRTGSYDLGLWTFIALDIAAAGLILSSRYMPGASQSRA